MENTERTIDIREYLKYVLENIPVFLGIAAAVFILYMLTGMAKGSDSVSESRDVLNGIRKQNSQAYFEDNGETTYRDIPDGAVNAQLSLYLDFNYQAVSEFGSVDYATMNETYEKDAWELLRSSGAMQTVIDGLSLQDYADLSDITPENLALMVEAYFQGGHIMNVVVTDTDEERAKQIAQTAAELFLENAEGIGLTKEARYLEGQEPVITVTRGSSAGISRIKRIIMGILAGIVVSLLLMLVWFICRDAIRTERDAGYAGTELLTRVPKKAGNAEAMKKLAAWLALREDRAKVVLTDTDGRINTEAIAETVNRELEAIGSNVRVVPARNMKEYADALVRMKDSDAVILTATYGKTAVKDVRESVRFLGQGDKTLYGIVLIG